MWNISTINNARCTCKIKSRFAKAKAELNKKKAFHQQIELKFKEETSKVLHLDYSFVWCCNLDTLESRPVVPGKFCNGVLEMAGEHQLEQLCEE
jgi:hypothetical protein